MPDAPPLLKGTLDVLVLKALAWDAMHGFEITTWLEERSSGLVAADEGALYHALHRLEERGFIASEWRLTQNNRRARYYKLLPAGRAHLKTEGANLERYARALTAILTARSA
ncbi:MAG: PadR family transcriptional regulator [Gemmatimonadetes bacterium]|nr:PadR family transcriptional regulator [Gemmatimonadota bacterium]